MRCMLRSTGWGMVALVLSVGCGDETATGPDPDDTRPDLAATVAVDRSIRQLDVVGAPICGGGAVTMLMSLTLINVFVQPQPDGSFLFRSTQIFKGTGIPPVGTDPETGAPLPAPDGTGYRFFQSRTNVQHFEPAGDGSFFMTTTAAFTARSIGPGPDLRMHTSYRQTFNPLTGEIAFKPGMVSIEGCTGK